MFPWRKLPEAIRVKVTNYAQQGQRRPRQTLINVMSEFNNELQM